jgi:hypothetical protein
LTNRVTRGLNHPKNIPSFPLLLHLLKDTLYNILNLNTWYKNSVPQVKSLFDDRLQKWRCWIFNCFLPSIFSLSVCFRPPSWRDCSKLEIFKRCAGNDLYFSMSWKILHTVLECWICFDLSSFVKWGEKNKRNREYQHFGRCWISCVSLIQPFPCLLVYFRSLFFL